MKIIHFSDPHSGAWLEDWRGIFDKRFLGVLNFNTRRRHLHKMDRLGKCVELILQEKPDVAICTGDLTSVGQPCEFEECLNILKPLMDSDIPLVYVPGNHDRYVKNTQCDAAMKDAVSKLNKKFGLSFDDFPSVQTVKGVDFFIVNESLPTSAASSCGYINKETNEFIMEQCAKPKERPRIFVGHYPLIEPFSIKRLRRRLWGQKSIVEALCTKVIDLALCGHIHHPFDDLDNTGRGETCAGSITKHGCLTIIDYSEENDQFTHSRVNVEVF